MPQSSYPLHHTKAVWSFKHSWARAAFVPDEQRLLQVLLKLTDASPEQIPTFASPKRRQEWLAARLLAASALSLPLITAHSAQGCPILPHGMGHISLAHSGGLVAVMRSTTHRVGIDVQLWQPKLRQVMPQFIGKDEEKKFSRHLTDAHLLAIWAAKEALYKALPQPDANLRHYHTIPFTPHTKGCLSLLHQGQQHEVAYELHGTAITAMVTVPLNP